MNRILCRAVWLVCIGCLAGLGAAAQAPLTLKQSIELALKQSPEEAEAHAEVDESRADVAQARTALLPQVGFTEDMSRGDDPIYVFGTRLRQQKFTQADFAIDSLNRPHPIGDFSTHITGVWQVFDSLRTERLIRGAALMQKGAVSQAGAIDQKTVFEVVAAYQQVLYAEREIDTAQHEVKTAEALLESVDDHVKAGLAVESDRMSAQVNLAACKQSLIEAEGHRELAWAQLRQAIGAPDLGETRLTPIEAHDFPQGDLQQELKTAASTRKDLAAAGEADQAQNAATSAARLNYGPHVNLYGNLGNDASSGSNGNNWVAGVQISIDLLPLSKRAQLAHEKAATARVNAQLESYRQRVRVEVNQAHIQLDTARQSMETAHAAIDQATESLRIIRNRYEAGLATITDLLRAEDAARQAQTSYWRAVYGNTVAYAQLLFATGTLTPEAAEDLQ